MRVSTYLELKDKAAARAVLHNKLAHRGAVRAAAARAPTRSRGSDAAAADGDTAAEEQETQGQRKIEVGARFRIKGVQLPAWKGEWAVDEVTADSRSVRVSRQHPQRPNERESATHQLDAPLKLGRRPASSMRALIADGIEAQEQRDKDSHRHARRAPDRPRSH